MPNRILRDWTTSETVDRLTTEQENAFTRLLMAVDDFGRYHADPRLLLARLYPLRVGTTSAQQMHSIRNALAAHGLVTIYTIEGRDYLQIVKWQNVPRAKESKFPACIADAVQVHSICTASAPVTVTGTDDRKPKPEPSLVESPKPKPDFPEDFAECWAAYPDKSGSKHKAFQAYCGSGATKDQVLDGIARYIAHVEAKRQNGFSSLRYQNGQTWFNGRGWLTEYETTNTRGHDEYADTF